MGYDTKQMMQESAQDMVTLVPKASVGIFGVITATALNTWIGIIVGILTAIFMVFQIEASMRKRKIAMAKDKEYQESKKKK